MGARARLRDLRDRAGLGAAGADRDARCRARDRGPWRSRRGSAQRPARAPTRRSRSPRASSRRAPRPRPPSPSSSPRRTSCGSSGLVLWVLIGWQFTLAEYLGGIVMIVLMTLMLRLFVSRRLEAQRARARRRQADSGHQHHAAGEQMRVARTPDLGLGVVGRRAQLPRRLADALQGDRDRVPARRVHRAARQRLLQRPVPERHAAGARRRSRTWSSVR